MSRYSEPICRLCRVEKTKLFLKGDKCLSDKCPVERRAYPPGQHGRARRRVLGYGLQLREKQKMKRFYGMSEKQFHLFFVRAEGQKGVTGETLLQMLERRLDNVLYIAGFSLSRAHARQLVCHGHVQVNDRRVGVPSAMVKAGDVDRLQDPLGQVRGLAGGGRFPRLEDHPQLDRGRPARADGPGGQPADPRRRDPARRRAHGRRALLQVREPAYDTGARAKEEQ